MMRGFHPNREEDVSRRYFECFCQYIYENRIVYCVLTNDQESRFIKKLLKMISEYMAGLSGKENDGDEQSREYAVAYSIGGVVGVLHKWMKEDFESSPGRIYQQLISKWDEGYSVRIAEVRKEEVTGMILPKPLLSISAVTHTLQKRLSFVTRRNVRYSSVRLLPL